MGPRAATAKGTTQPGPIPSPSVHRHLPALVELRRRLQLNTSPSILMDGVSLSQDGVGAVWAPGGKKILCSRGKVKRELQPGMFQKN